MLQNSSGLLAAITNNFHRVRAIRQAASEASADIVISHLTETNILTVLASAGSKFPVVITEHCDPENLSYGKFWSVLRRLTYPHAKLLVSVSQGVENFFSWLPKERKQVIYNPFFIPDSGDSVTKNVATILDKQTNTIVSMGRLTHQKGFDLLINVFSKLASKYKDWSLVILGEGELRNDLEELIKDLGISSRVSLPGRVNDPFSILRKSDLFVMSSRFEGFPMAHGEAMMCGLPIVATDCPSGPSELIRNGVDGLLVPNGDEETLQEAIEELISNPELRGRMSRSASQVTERFDSKSIVSEWITAFNQLTPQNTR